MFTAEDKSHEEHWRKTRSLRLARAWWESGNVAATGTGSPPSSLQGRCGRAHHAKRVSLGSTAVVGHVGSAEQLGKRSVPRCFFFLFVLC